MAGAVKLPVDRSPASACAVASIPVVVLAAMLLAAPPAGAQADLGPRTPVEGGALIMPEHDLPPGQGKKQDESKPEERRTKPAHGHEKSPPSPPGNQRSMQADCKRNPADCRQDPGR